MRRDADDGDVDAVDHLRRAADDENDRVRRRPNAQVEIAWRIVRPVIVRDIWPEAPDRCLS